MKKASKLEKAAARCWNVLNEGKPFTPVFVLGMFALYHISLWDQGAFWVNLLLTLFVVLPVFAIWFHYDYPLHLRWFLWLPFAVACRLWYQPEDWSLFALAIAAYFFFTVILWGTIYYHLRIGTSLLNFTRFWKLVLKNSDSTSGNAQEQLPKVLTLLLVMETAYRSLGEQLTGFALPYLLFAAGLFVYSYVIHRLLFTWKPKEIAAYTTDPKPDGARADKVYVIVIDGCNKERLAAAETPFLDRLRADGTEYLTMETVYPARTVVCFSSMFTGTYPREHGITSNMVYKQGIRTESIFDSLRKVGKTGVMLAVAHLVDAFGRDVETFTAVMKNDVVDRKILERAKQIVEEQDPDLLIVQLISTDQTGHSRGVYYDEYLQKIAEADALIAGFYEWLEARGKLHNAALIVCADHGQSDGIGGHGHLDEGERFVPFIMHGPMIKRGLRVKEHRSLVSVAPTISWLMGAPYPACSRGPVLMEAMTSERVQMGEERNGTKAAVYRHSGPQ
ncbi:MAG: alkaline phosphatase family protein [Brevibacillus sp.]|nr:alkaline phosphatase family protein [Brevibacillus sp.]